MPIQPTQAAIINTLVEARRKELQDPKVQFGGFTTDNNALIKANLSEIFLGMAKVLGKHIFIDHYMGNVSRIRRLWESIKTQPDSFPVFFGVNINSVLEGDTRTAIKLPTKLFLHNIDPSSDYYMAKPSNKTTNLHRFLDENGQILMEFNTDPAYPLLCILPCMECLLERKPIELTAYKNVMYQLIKVILGHLGKDTSYIENQVVLANKSKFLSGYVGLMRTLSHEIAEQNYNIRRQISDLESTLRDKKETLETNNQIIARWQKEGIDKIANFDFNTLMAHPKITAIDIYQRTIELTTVPLITKFEYDEQSHTCLLGRYKIKLDTKEAKVRLQNLENHKVEARCHPHAYENGMVCYGNISSTIDNMMASCEYATLLLLVLEFLENGVSPTDTLGRTVLRWPTLSTPIAESDEDDDDDCGDGDDY
jgi:hypothetical protein